MERESTPICRTCGATLTANERGRYIDCCAPRVTPPRRRSPFATMLGSWSNILERALFGDDPSGRISTRRRLCLLAVTTILIGLPCIIPACKDLF